MVGSWRAIAIIVLLGLAVPMAHACGSRSGGPPIAYSYFYSVPMTYYYAYPPAAKVIPLYGACEPVPPPPLPPQTKEPPLKKQATLKAPLIEASPGNRNDRCSVTFWNLTGREVTLAIGGKTHVLLKNRKLTLDLDREFRWRTREGPGQIERVPDGQSSFDVVVRE